MRSAPISPQCRSTIAIAAWRNASTLRPKTWTGRSQGNVNRDSASLIAAVPQEKHVLEPRPCIAEGNRLEHDHGRGRQQLTAEHDAQGAGLGTRFERRDEPVSKAHDRGERVVSAARDRDVQIPCNTERRAVDLTHPDLRRS